MIGGLLEALRAQVAAPQADVGAPAPGEVDRRAWLDLDASPIGAQLTELDVVGLTTTPVNFEIGSGFGGAPGGIATLRHLAAVVLTVEDASVADAVARRDAITTDLLRRAAHVDWTNVYLAADQTVQDVNVTVEYASLESDTNNAYATVTFTVDVEWRL